MNRQFMNCSFTGKFFCYTKPLLDVHVRTGLRQKTSVLKTAKNDVRQRNQV